MDAERRQKKQERTRKTFGSTKFSATHRGIPRSAKVARGRGHGQDNMGHETQKRRKDGKRLWKRPECNKGLKDLGLRQQLQDPDTRQLRLRIEMTSNDIFGETTAKRVVVTSRGLRRTRKWILWRGRPPPKRKKKLQGEREPLM
jgi:hypothetical protein